MTLKTVLQHFAAVTIIVLTVLGMMMIESEHKDMKEAKYPQVHFINNEYKDVLDSLGIEKIEYYDWEETANALNIKVSNLSVTIFMDHLVGKPEYYNQYAY